MLIYDLIEYSDNYAKLSWSLWQYLKDVPTGTKTDSEPFKFKAGITGSTLTDGDTKDVEIAVPLKYLSHFWGALEMPLNPMLIWSAKCVITDSPSAGTFAVTDTKLYVPVVNSR